MSAEWVYQTRKALCWQPTLGGGFRIGWGETLDLPPVEVEEMLDDCEELRRKEIRGIKSILQYLRV